MKKDKLLPTNIVAARLGKSTRTVQRLIGNGDLIGIRTGTNPHKGPFSVFEYDLDKYINSRMQMEVLE